jgi:2-oxoisovalerate dehydrogenase E1 component
MTSVQPPVLPTGLSPENILEDYRIAWRSRHASLIGRREVLTGKAKFGIFGDGKEVAQLAMARAFRAGDFRSGYYRDQTFIFATGIGTVEQFFAQLYADTDVSHDPFSAGRSMNSHFASRYIGEDGRWKAQVEVPNSSSDVSPTGSQMPRLVGLAYASRLYRELESLREMESFSRNGDEIAFGTIGNASCAEGMFWESINAAGVLGVPMLVSIWDDGYGISVPNEFQITKGNISELLRGFRRAPGQRQGYDIHTVRGWDYPALCDTYRNAAETVRREHVPAIIHVVEMTQPQGHSTSGSHERYKSKDRLRWEEEFDPIQKMRDWMIAHSVSTPEQVDAIEKEELESVRAAQRRSWQAYRDPIEQEKSEFLALAASVSESAQQKEPVNAVAEEIRRHPVALRRDLVRAATTILVATRDSSDQNVKRLAGWRETLLRQNQQRISSHLYSESPRAAIHVGEIPPRITEESPMVNGFEIINACFDSALQRIPQLTIMGEDVGNLGDVNQGCAGLQEKYGLLRVSDTGIRECTIVGQAIGMAMRGLRPIAEVQYLDYLLYALQILSDDLATLRWRTAGGQEAPVIIRTRGHRLEGIWHSGSPMAGVINLVRGMYLCVPRNMTQAAGFYNTLLQSDDPAIVVEVLNGYRVKERRPENIGEFTVPLGIPEILREGADVTVVTYGATCRVALDAADLLQKTGISAEIIDVQTLLPFDVHGVILESVKKTARAVFVDEDVPGGASAYMMQQTVERMGAYEYLDSEPRTISAQAHRPAYGSDGDYWSKPGREQIFEVVYQMMHEADPANYPLFL